MLSLLAGYLPPSKSLFVQAFGLVFLILLILNILFLSFWTITKSKFLLFSLLIIVAGFGNIFNNFQVTFLNSTIKKDDQIKVLSYNVQNFAEKNNTKTNKKIKTDIIGFLINEDADIVCLQEYHSIGSQLYEPTKEIKDTLNAVSYYYESYFNPKHNQLTGLIIFSKYKAVNKGRLKFKGSRTFGIFTDVVVGTDTIRVFNIHFASIKLVPADIDFVITQGTESGNEFKTHSFEIYNKLGFAFKLRERQLNYLSKIIISTKYKIILCGDFNDTPSSWVYAQLSGPLNDAFVKKGTGIGSTYAGQLPLLRIDYIFTDEGLRTVGFTRHDFERSDHNPVSAILSKK